MDITVLKTLLIMILSASLFGCGGGGGSSSSANNSVDMTTISGGRISSPTTLQPSKMYEISNDRAQNNFVYNANDGEIAIIHVVLNTPHTSSQRSACSRAGEKPSAGFDIHVYDLNRVEIGGTCREELLFSFPSTGNYSFEFDYGGVRSGYFWFTTVNNESLNHKPDEPEGSPNSPKVISELSQNSIVNEPFLGFYQISLNAGEKLTINSILSPTFSDKTLCARNLSSDDHSAYIAVFDSDFSEIAVACGDYLEFTAPKDGLYVVWPYYYGRYSGYFNADRF